MQKTISSLLFLFACLEGISQDIYQKPETVSDFDLKGPVKELTLTQYCGRKYPSGLFVWSVQPKYRDYCFEKIKFNNSGQMTEYTYEADSTGWGESFFAVYDTLDRVISYMIIPMKGDTAIIRYQYSHHESIPHTVEKYLGQSLYEVSWITKDSTQNTYTVICENHGAIYGLQRSEVIYELDSKDRIVAKKELNDLGQVAQQKTWLYSSTDKLYYSDWIEYTYNSKSEVLRQHQNSKTVITFDKSDIKSSHIEYGKTDDDIIYRHDYYYKPGNSGAMADSITSSQGFYMLRQFDNSGRCTGEKVCQNYNNTAWLSKTFAFDEQGNLIFEEEIINSVVKKRNRYEYDSHGNWIKKYYLDWDGTEKLATRTITYYE